MITQQDISKLNKLIWVDETGACETDFYNVTVEVRETGFTLNFEEKELKEINLSGIEELDNILEG